MLPSGESFNESWFIDQNLVPSPQSFFPSGWSPWQKELMVRVGNAPVHKSRMARNFFVHNPLKRLPHPPRSPDMSPSDFYPFGKVKGTRTGPEIPDEISLRDAVTAMLNDTSTDELQRVFRSWIERVENVITAEEGYASS
jgi:histone-lysine N-methyltransferase SETMAR